MCRRKRKNMVKPKRRTVGSNPKREAEVCAEAFRRCRSDLKKFILSIEDGLYAKGIISDDTHDDIHGQSIVESEKRQILLDAVEKKLRTAESGAEFGIILGLFKKHSAHNIVVKRLSEARENCQLITFDRKRSSRIWIYVAIGVIVAVLFSYSGYTVLSNDGMTQDSGGTIKKENAFIKILKDKYNRSNLMLGPSYSTVPYMNVSIFPYPDRDWMARSHEKQDSQNMTFLQPVSLDELLNVSTGDRILIIGGPGTGKTRLTLEIMRMWTNNKVLLSCELLFVYRLRWFSLQKKEIDLRSIVSMHMEGSPVVDEIVNKELYITSGKKICFLLDGLDEYEPGYSDMNNYVFLLMHRQALSNAVVIVTTRNITSTGFETIEWTRRYQVTGFSDEQLKNYFEYFQSQTNQNLTSLVAMHSDLWLICKIPLHVSLLVNALGGETIDTAIITATQLFEVITIKTFENDFRKASEPKKTTKIRDLKHLLEEFPVFVAVCSLASKGTLSYSRQYSFNDSEVPPELKGTNLSYFQIEPQPGASNMEIYTFIHPTLMDFLAAVYLTSLSEDEQVVIIAEHCGFEFNFGYDDFHKFYCGLTHNFIPLYQTFNICHLSSFIKFVRMAHCIFEAQSHTSQDKVQAAAHSLMQDEQGYLMLFISLTAYDMQAIGFVASSSPRDFKSLKLVSTTVRGGYYDLSFLFDCLAKSRANFSNFELLSFSHIYDRMKHEQPIIDFFKHTPRLRKLEFIDVSEHLLQQLVSLAPQSCSDIIVYKTFFGTNTGITPYSLIEHREMKVNMLHLANCSISDKHLFDMKSTPWLVNTNILGLSHNYITSEGAFSIARSFINTNTTQYYFIGPVWLDLKYNNIGGIGLVALLIAADTETSRLEYIDLTGNNITDNDVNLIMRACLTFYRQTPIRILLLKNNLTEDGETKLRYIGVQGRSQCYIYFESLSEEWFNYRNVCTEQLFRTLDAMLWLASIFGAS